MKRNVFSFTRRFTIENREGDGTFSVNGLGFGLDFGLFNLRDQRGAMLAAICRKFLSWNGAYEIRRDGQPAVVVGLKQRDFTQRLGAGFEPLFGPRNLAFTATIPGSGNLVIERNLTGVTYEFKRGNEVIAAFTEHEFSIAGIYDVNIVDGEDDILILACAAVVLFMHRRKR
jgi:uncharacterized protein YxjI